MTVSYQVVITDLINDDLEPEREVLGELAHVTALHARSEAELVGRIEQADAVILYHELALTEATIRRLERCRVIVRGGVGFDNVDRPLCRQLGIPVANVPDYGTEEVADSALAMLLGLARGIHLANSVLRAGQGDWSYERAVPLMRLRGSVLGIVGLGRIGTAMAMRGKSLGMDVAFFDPYKPDGYDKSLGIRRVETLDELLARVAGGQPALSPERRDVSLDRCGGDRQAAARVVLDQHGSRRRGRCPSPAGRPGVGATGRRRDRRAGTGTAVAGRSPVARLARPAAPGPSPSDPEPASGLVLPAGPTRVAPQDGRNLPPRPAGVAVEECGQLGL